MTVKVARLRDTIRSLPKYRASIFALQLAVLFALPIASVNVANMLLARNATRRQEFTIRMALGAGRGRLARQLLVESLTLGRWARGGVIQSGHPAHYARLLSSPRHSATARATVH